MTYAATEISTYLHSPIELYEFSQVGVNIYTYSSGDHNVTYGGATYEPIAIMRNRIEQSQNISRTGLKIQMPITIPLIYQYISNPPANVIDLTIRRFHKQDPDEEVIIFWKGRVINVDFKKTIGELLCEPLITAMRRPVLRRLYQVICPHLLYRSSCGVNEIPFRENATVSTISGFKITSSTFGAQPNDYFAGGLVRITKAGIPFARSILSHTGDEIEIDLSINGLEPGDVLQSLPGCSRTLPDCITKFNNEENYGGYPFIPTKNPMGSGAPIW